MNSVWQKFLAIVKFVVLGLLLIHVIMFIVLNISAVVSEQLSLIYRKYDRPNFLLVMLLTSVLSIFGWWLFRITLKTIRQINESNSRARTSKLERDMAEIKSKAAMLQTKPAARHIKNCLSVGLFVHDDRKRRAHRPSSAYPCAFAGSAAAKSAAPTIATPIKHENAGAHP